MTSVKAATRANSLREARRLATAGRLVKDDGVGTAWRRISSVANVPVDEGLKLSVMAALLRRAGLKDRVESDRLKGYARNPRLARLGKGNASVYAFDPAALPVPIGATRFAEKVVFSRKEAAREIVALSDLKGSLGVIPLESYNLNFGDRSAQLVFPRMVGTLADVFAIGKLRHAELAYVLQKVLESLDAIHAKKWNHFDLKGANVLVDDRADIYISDFDLAKKFDEKVASGTPGHRAPEFFYNSPESLEEDELLSRGETDKYLVGTMCLELLLDEPLPDKEEEIGKIIYGEYGEHQSIVPYLRRTPRFAQLFAGDELVVEQFQRFLDVAMKKKMDARGHLRGEDFVTHNAANGREGFVRAVELQAKLILAEEMKQYYKAYEADFMNDWRAKRARGMQLEENPPPIETRRDSEEGRDDANVNMRGSVYAVRDLNVLQDAAVDDAAGVQQPPARAPNVGEQQNAAAQAAALPPVAVLAEPIRTAISLDEDDEAALEAARAISDEVIRTGRIYTSEQFVSRMDDGRYKCTFPLPAVINGQAAARPCEKISRDKYNAVSHVRARHVKEPLKECPRCNVWFPTAQHFNWHQTRCAAAQPNQ